MIKLPPKQVLADDQAIGDAFNLQGGRTFILLKGHAGGEWKLQIFAPDGEWMDIADDSGGISFDSAGLQFFYAQGWLSYRLNGGVMGAKAWVFNDEPVPGFNPS